MTLRRTALLAATTAGAALLASCVSAPEPQPPAPSPVPRGVQQQVTGTALRWVGCSDDCQKPTPKSRPGAALASGKAASIPSGMPVAIAALLARAASTPTSERDVLPVASTASSPSAASRLSAPTEKTLVRAAVRFPFADASLSADANAQLARLAPVLAAATRIRVTGFTDDKGGQEANDKLAGSRALAVVLFLRDELHVGGAHVIGTGRALCCYRVQNVDESGRAVNRRAELDIELPLNAATDQLVERAKGDLVLSDGRTLHVSGGNAGLGPNLISRLPVGAALSSKVSP